MRRMWAGCGRCSPHRHFAALLPAKRQIAVRNPAMAEPLNSRGRFEKWRLDMNLSNIAKITLAASAVAGLALMANSSPGKAQAAASCAAYAHDVADENAPRYRGFVGGLVALPFDVTDALLTGHTRDDFRWKSAYDAAYADCV